jgi:hypothetical protein
LKLGLYPVNYLTPPIKRCLKFMAPAVKKIEFLLIGHVFPVYFVVPASSTNSPLLSHGEISRLRIPAEILAFSTLVEMPAISQKYRNFWRQVARTDESADPSEIVFPLPDEHGLPDRLDYSPDPQPH